MLFGRHHEHAGFDLSFDRKRNVNGHLVTVEVGVERRANERMELNRFSFDQHRLESLNPQAVEGRRAVEQHRMPLDDFFEDVPNFLALASRSSSWRTGWCDIAVLQRACCTMKGLKSSSAISFGKTALMKLAVQDRR